ncbi:MAG: DUF4158 domain-containing protein [Rubrobacter sp.]|nr:DUF4158 domain-containing protein [Rubrobacter sp.]
MTERELVRHHTLSEADLTAISIRRGAANRLGFAVQLCLLRYPARPLRHGEVVPRPVVEFVASQVGADPDASDHYASGPEGAGRDTTRREHHSELRALAWGPRGRRRGRTPQPPDSPRPRGREDHPAAPEKVRPLAAKGYRRRLTCGECGEIGRALGARPRDARPHHRGR